MIISFKWLLVLSVYLTTFYEICEASRLGYRTNRRTIPPKCVEPVFRNGYFVTRLNSLYFYCNHGFKLLGRFKRRCRNGRFDHEMPVCAKTGCDITQQRANGTIQLQRDKMTLKMSCDVGFDLAGSAITYCDGEEWDRQLGECREESSQPKVCDFETASLCGWTQNRGENDFNWIRKNGFNSFGTLKFGPKHDHTIGKPLEGHYLVAEATNSRSIQTSRFWSPIHSSADSQDACFRFYYHMFGAYAGRLRVFVKPWEMDFEEIAEDPDFIYFENRYSSNLWYEGFFHIPPTDSNFQIVFEAMVAENRITDIAIDDVALLTGVDCMDGGTTTTEWETPSEEPDGIFNIQSCENRCTETKSVFTNGNETIFEDGETIEKCDCHEDCWNFGTCCIDYQLSCLDSQASDPDSTTTTLYSTSTETSTDNSDAIQFQTTKTLTHNPTLSSVQPQIIKWHIKMPPTSPPPSMPPTPTIYMNGMVHSHAKGGTLAPNILANSKNRIPIQMHSKLVVSTNARRQVKASSLIAAGVVVACVLCISAIGWRRYKAHKSKMIAVHKIYFAPGQSNEGLLIRFNSTVALDEPPANESTNESKPDDSNTKVNFLNKLNQQFRPSQLFANQFDEKKCLLGDHEEGDSSL